MVLDKPVDNMNSDAAFAGFPVGQLPHHPAGGDLSFRMGLKPWQKHKPSIEILCNNQVNFLTCCTRKWYNIMLDDGFIIVVLSCIFEKKIYLPFILIFPQTRLESGSQLLTCSTLRLFLKH